VTKFRHTTTDFFCKFSGGQNGLKTQRQVDKLLNISRQKPDERLFSAKKTKTLQKMSRQEFRTKALSSPRGARQFAGANTRLASYRTAD
jgi:hypothetical protein